MCPSEGRDVGEKVCRGALALLFSFGGGLTEVEGVPKDYDGCKQVETGHAIVLSLCGAIPDFTLATDAQRVFQGVMGLVFVQADLGPALHVVVEEPLDDEERALDATDFTQRNG